MRYKIERRAEEIDEQLNRAFEAEASGSNYPGMSYEQGVKYAIDWITGQSEEEPIPER